MSLSNIDSVNSYEVDRNEKVGIGFFSDVYKGTWRGLTVAIKVLADTTPRNLFVREVAIWKQLKHPNVLELYGASSASGDPPWFFVSPYEKNGSLAEFLRKVGMSPSVMHGVVAHSGASTIGVGGMTDSYGRSRTASFPGWSGGGMGSLVGVAASAARERESSLGAGLVGRGRSGSVGQGDVPKEWDLLRFMHEIAKGMEYLHSQGVLHGDLKVRHSHVLR